jgi:hypothetical protein
MTHLAHRRDAWRQEKKEAGRKRERERQREKDLAEILFDAFTSNSSKSKLPFMSNVAAGKATADKADEAARDLHPVRVAGLIARDCSRGTKESKPTSRTTERREAERRRFAIRQEEDADTADREAEFRELEQAEQEVAVWARRVGITKKKLSALERRREREISIEKGTRCALGYESLTSPPSGVSLKAKFSTYWQRASQTVSLIFFHAFVWLADFDAWCDNVVFECESCALSMVGGCLL